jgi:hypothetical protein
LIVANYINAAFTAYPRPGVTQEQIEQALKPLLGYLGTFLRPAEAFAESNIWYDGNEVGCVVTGSHGWNFKDMFDAAAAGVAELCDDAFESTLIDDDAGCEEDRTIADIWSPNETARRRRRIESALTTVGSALADLRLVQPCGLHAAQIADSQSVSVVSRNQSPEARVVMTLDLEALEAAGLDARQKQAFAEHVYALSGLLQEWSRGAEVAVLARADAHAVVDLTDLERARMTLPTSRAWEICTDRDETRSTEFHFQHVHDPSLRHCVSMQDGVVVASEQYRAEEQHRRDVPRG